VADTPPRRSPVAVPSVVVSLMKSVITVPPTAWHCGSLDGSAAIALDAVSPTAREPTIDLKHRYRMDGKVVPCMVSSC
jgi:hypothetical protein